MSKKLAKSTLLQKTLIFLILGLIVLTGLSLYNGVNKNSRSELVLTDIPADKEQEITTFLLSQPSLSWKTVPSSKNFCVFENLDSTNTNFPISLWVRCGEFIGKGLKVGEVSGISVPVLLEYSDDKGYTVKMPRDGSLNESDIKTIFSEEIQRKIFSYDATMINYKLQGFAEQELIEAKL